MPLPVAVIAAVLAGAGLDLAYPELGWWPVAFVSVTVALWTLQGRSLPAAFLVSLAYGAAFYFTHLSWVSRYLGPIPWVALAGLESILFGAGGILITLAYRFAATTSRYRSVLVSAWVAGLWVLRETIMGNWPYGGFPWARTGLTLVDSPFSEAASWVGTTGLSFILVVICASALQALNTRRWQGWIPPVFVVLLTLLMPLFPTEQAGTFRVGWVQGNGPSGYFDTKSAGDILDAQEDASAPLVGPSMDLLVWPEGSVDADPLKDPAAAARLDRLVDNMGAPALVNAATTRDGKTYNTSMLWDGDGAIQLHDKANPVPFGEYVPDRWFYEALAPDLVGMIQREYTPGSNAPVMDVDGTRIGLAICFDVIYDDVIREGADAGAQLYVFQTNNADFRGTDENLQQLATARMRAIETGRTVVNVSTTGTSQIIGKDGTVLSEIPVDTAGARVTEVTLNDGTTPAVVLMPWIGPVLSVTSAVALLAAAFTKLRSRTAGATRRKRNN
ncbi:acyltransferase [Microbacterium sp. CH12i]|uniref:apolipoprotein N-acyltransferase n=1 Tax=Microbacterium sp. CH12i TaxID=1479651 RepID=UPI0004613D59|nr:apolipoprotein N-acyltransferase [Microbacterium sp. CH12i]KDA04544.1 acyltransferase [Microbacterium sp. CH12i]